MNYFVYGSNLNIDDLKKWCKKLNEKVPEMKNPTVYKLKDYKIGFTRKSITRGGGVADIIPSKEDYCYGVIFDISEEDLKIIDKKEGVKEENKGAYKRIELTSDVISYDVVYKQSDFVPPTDEYLDAIIMGARKFGLPKEWISKLESFRAK